MTRPLVAPVGYVGEPVETARRSGQARLWLATFGPASLLSLVWLVFEPPSTDIAAHLFRVEWFRQSGFAVWNNFWYAGHHTPGYSVLAPALGAWFGVRTLLVVSVLAACGFFALLVNDRPHMLGAVAWFSAVAPISLFTGRVPFALGLALGIAALWAAKYNGYAGMVVAVLTALASPVAAAFLALAGAAWFIGSHAYERPRAAFGVVFGGLGTFLLLQVAFPEGGKFPFPATALLPALGGALVVVLMIRRRTVVSTGAVLFAVACVLAFVIPTAAGSNVVRLGTMTIGPALAVSIPDRKRTLALLAPILLVWSWWPAHFSWDHRNDRSANAEYYDPLINVLSVRQSKVGFERVEVVPVATHMEAVRIGARFGIARGWERQLDRQDNLVLYDAGLTADEYRAWLDANAVSLVAFPASAPLDEGGVGEAAVLSAPVPYLTLIWGNSDWRLYEVTNPVPLVSGPARITAVTPTRISLEFTSGDQSPVTVRFRHDRWVHLTTPTGCMLASQPDRWISLRAISVGSAVLDSYIGDASNMCKSPNS
jgi:hypothetical protein